MPSNTKNNDMYIYHLPYPEHKELCRILDRDMRWEELAGRYMNFDMMTIHDLRRDDLRGISPTSQLLTMWGQQNHTVVQLFVLLSKMHHYQAMTVLKPFVDTRYHALINEGEENISVLLDKEENSANGDSSRHDHNRPGDLAAGGDGAASAAAGPSPVDAAASHSNSPMDKNMNVGSHNLNVCDVQRYASQPKVVFPPVQEQPERKILNTPMPFSADARDSARGNVVVPHVTVSTPSSVIPPVLSPQPLLHGVASALEEKVNNNPISPARKLSSGSEIFAESIPQIQYSELGKATNNWGKTTIVGKGGFGIVFKGIWKNTLVAIKRIEQRGAESIESHRAQVEQTLRELRILNAVRHDNILPLYGFSGDGPEPCLVYQFMPNGSLEDRLLCRQGSSPLVWCQRHNIARGTARGLQFLHTKPFVHGDIKSANILLDNNFEPRIGDFGLAREGPQSQYTHKTISRVHGTLPYLPNDFLRNKKMSTKVDTYSFGIVLFELVTGLRAYDDTRKEKFLIDHVLKWDVKNVIQLHDRKPGSLDLYIFKYLIDLGKECVNSRARERPEMEQVLEKLEEQRRQLGERAQSFPPGAFPLNPVKVVCEVPALLPETLKAWSPSPVLQTPDPSCYPRPMPVAAGSSGARHSHPALLNGPSPPAGDGAKLPVLAVYEENQSSVETSEEIGAEAAVVCSASEVNDSAPVPLLSALGFKDSNDSTDSEDITAKGKEPLTIFNQ